MEMIIRGGKIYDAVHREPYEADVLVRDGKIAEIGANLAVSADAEVVDAKGLNVYPGLVEAHGHIGLDGWAIGYEGQDYNEYNDPVTPQLRAIDGINPFDYSLKDAALGGVTTICAGPGSSNVIGGTFAAFKTVGKCIDDMCVKPEAAMKIAFGENPKGCYGNDGKKRPVTRMAIAATLRDTLTKAKRYAEEIAEAEKDPSKRRPYDMQLEALLPVIRKEIPLKAHAHRADDILTALRIAKEFDVDITLDHVTEGHLIASKLAAAGKPVLVGPSFVSKSKYELRERTFATAGILNKAGLEVCLITDAPVVPLCYLPLCAGLAVKEGLDEDEAWKAITINPARAAGIDARVGSLEPGKDADVAIFDGNPLHDICCRTKQVFVNGVKQLD